MALTLPASNADVLAQAINPALYQLSAAMATDEARCMLLAIGRQESAFERRDQMDGPARGLWQFERNGIIAVMRNNASGPYVETLCHEHGILYSATAIYSTLDHDDELAAAMARLLVWTDALPLPAIGDCMGAWNLYERLWRPGVPSYSRWKSYAYPMAVETMRGQSA